MSLDPKALMDIFRQTQNTNTVLQVEVDGGKPVPCLVREVQRNPLSREVLHIDLLRVEKDREVQVMVPLKPVGRPKGLAMGGKLRMVRRELEVSCSYERIPKAIEVDVSHLDLGDNVRVEEVKAPEGVTLLFDSNFNVAAVHGRRVSGKKK